MSGQVWSASWTTAPWLTARIDHVVNASEHLPKNMSGYPGCPICFARKKEMCIYLKVKLRSLAAESRIIRNEERKQLDNYTREQLYLHRIKDVREEARATHIAYAFLRKVPFKMIEHPVHSPRHLSKHNPIRWDRVYRMVSKYAHWDADLAKSEVLKWAYTA